MEEFMSENNSGAFVPQQDNRSGDQNREKRQKFDPAKQDGRRNNYNRNRRRRNNGPRQGGYDKKGDNAEVQAEGIRTVSAILTDRITATGSSIISANRIRAARRGTSSSMSASPRISAPESLAMK